MEVKEEITGFKKLGIFFGATAICGFYALGFILLPCVYALSEAVSLGALIVGLGMALIGTVTFVLARKQQNVGWEQLRSLHDLDSSITANGYGRHRHLL
jgi:hypothetical protein